MKPKAKKGKFKIPAIRVSADDCAINVGQVIEDGEVVDAGTPYYVHEDEWVELTPVITVREVMQLSKLQQAASDTNNLGENLTMLCNELSKRVIAWNWTDLAGDALDQPYNRPDVLEGLSSDELLWLVNAASNQETTQDRKKGLQNLEDISLEMAHNQTASQ